MRQSKDIEHGFDSIKAKRALRQGWAPYLPAGKPEACPQCKAVYYPMGSGDCWRCGHLG